MAFSIKTCPHCKRTYTETYTIDIGQPFRECVDCKGIVIDRDVTEWELKNVFQKIFYFVAVAFSSVMIGFIGGMILAVLKAYDVIDVLGPRDENFLSISMFFAVVIFLYGTTVTLKNDIKESNKRMRDPNYRDKLRRMGLLK